MTPTREADHLRIRNALQDIHESRDLNRVHIFRDDVIIATLATLLHTLDYAREHDRTHEAAIILAAFVIIGQHALSRGIIQIDGIRPGEPL